MTTLDQVTRATQRKWLKQLARAALPRFGIEDAELRFISDSSAVVFRVDAPHQRYALRIDPDPTNRWLTWTRAELLWLSAIKRDTDLSVPEPVATLDGSLTPRVPTVNIPEGRLVTMLRWLPGQSIGKRPVPNLARKTGAFMAQLHDHTERFTLPDDADRPHTSWGKLTYWQDNRYDTAKTLTVKQRDLCAAASARLLEEISEMGTSKDYGLVHANLTLNNCLMHRRQLSVIDFADARYASHYYDIAVPLTDMADHWHLGDQPYERLRAELYGGYSSVRPLGSRYGSAVDAFAVARAFDVIEWIHIDWPSPTHYSSGPELLAQSLHRIRDYMRDL